MPQKVEVLH